MMVRASTHILIGVIYTKPTVIYNMYLQLGVDGLRGLENYDPTTKVSSF